MCSSPHAGFNGVFRISKLFFVLELFEFEVGKISKFFNLVFDITLKKNWGRVLKN